jgi:tRNA1(Val) A37 N6-methylase TrmN6
MKVNNIDTFYTPPELAERLLSYVDYKKVTRVADFCVGKGELLKAAETKFGSLECYGTDIDDIIVSEIKKSNSNWNIAICDFTNKQSRENTSILKEADFDLVLLNPPFTCKGSKINKVEFCDNIFHVSTAMTFLVESLRYLSKEGRLYAIMPASVVYSAKDKKLITAISEKYEIELLEEREKQLFKNCTPNIVLLKLERKILDTKCTSVITLNATPILFDAKNHNINIFRGNLSVHEATKYENSQGLKYVHSTSLRNSSIISPTMTIDRPQSVVNGPAILLHRVGKPDITKVCIISKTDSYILSDCVIALLSDNKETIQSLFDTIISKENVFYSLYKGTGAKYITIERLKEALNLC